jgi:hypothetical protein
MSDEPIESAGFRGLKHPGRERKPDALALPIIADNQPHLGATVVDGAEAAERHDFGAIGRLQFREERQPPTVVHSG